MIAIIDYGAGNLFSVKNALDYLGIESQFSNDKAFIESADEIILPGVGAFPSAMKKLSQTGLIETLQAEALKKPFLGICLGMQMLFEKAYEFEEADGLGLIKGKVDKIVAPGMKIPHMGWNRLEKLNDCPLLTGIKEDEYVYFVHSYRAFCDDESISAYCEYSDKIPALVFNNYDFGAQFHPEKSSYTGLRILKNFSQLK